MPPYGDRKGFPQYLTGLDYGSEYEIEVIPVTQGRKRLARYDVRLQRYAGSSRDNAIFIFLAPLVDNLLSFECSGGVLGGHILWRVGVAYPIGEVPKLPISECRPAIAATSHTS